MLQKCPIWPREWFPSARLTSVGMARLHSWRDLVVMDAVTLTNENHRSRNTFHTNYWIRKRRSPPCPEIWKRGSFPPPTHTEAERTEDGSLLLTPHGRSRLKHHFVHIFPHLSAFVRMCSRERPIWLKSSSRNVSRGSSHPGGRSFWDRGGLTFRQDTMVGPNCEHSWCDPKLHNPVQSNVRGSLPCLALPPVRYHKKTSRKIWGPPWNYHGKISVDCISISVTNL